MNNIAVWTMDPKPKPFLHYEKKHCVREISQNELRLKGHQYFRLSYIPRATLRSKTLGDFVGGPDLLLLQHFSEGPCMSFLYAWTMLGRGLILSTHLLSNSFPGEGAIAG